MASPFTVAYQQSRVGVQVVRAQAERAAPEGWRDWLREIFPQSVAYPMAPHHVQFWEHVWAIDYRTAPRPFFGVWSREGGKSTNVELASVALGVRGARRYIVYVRQTQEAADNSVANIKEKLESAAIETYYPSHSRPLLSKFGNSRGWRRNRLRTAGGFTIDALGLDVGSVRGLKVGDERPDVIIFDDIDAEDDTPASTVKKRRRITTAILPAGARDRCAVIGIQNLIIADGIFTTIVDGRADYLTDKVVSGPHPAVRGLKWEWKEDAESGARVPKITAGTPTWEGQSIPVCEQQMRRWGPSSFMREAQHEVRDKVEGLALNFDDAEHFVDMTLDEIKALVQLGQPFGGLDFGAWRFAFTAWAADTNGCAVRIDELFSQREEAAVRARRIHDKCERLGIVRGDRMLVPKFQIWGDAANPSDITELNAAWKRGWRDEKTGRLIKSPLRVIAVGMAEKMRRASVERINDKLGARAIRFARSVGVGDKWQHGYNAGSGGTEMIGSRLLWELRHWAYPVPPDGKVDLKQDPSDHTADGADMIASMRYALMSWWRPGKEKDEGEISAFAPEVLEASVERSYILKHRKRSRRGRVIDPQFGEF